MRMTDATITQLIPIHCQICEERIAMANPKDLSVPIHGSMFVSPYPDRMPESIIQPTEWEFIRCPYCNTRPFIRDDEVLTDKGGILQTNDGVYRIPNPVQDIEDESKENVNYYRTSSNQDGADMPEKYPNNYYEDYTDDGDRSENKTSEGKVEPIDTFKTAITCDCCDPPREFKNKAGRSSHIRAMRRKK